MSRNCLLFNYNKNDGNFSFHFFPSTKLISFKEKVKEKGTFMIA